MALTPNSSSGNEYKQLSAIFKAHFQGDLHLSRIRLIALFISALCKVKSVNYSALAAGFDSRATSASCFRRIQRFMAESDLTMEMVAKVIFKLLPVKGKVTLVMDRTNWQLGKKNINILMLGVSYKNVAFPLIFEMLDKKGNSNTAERIALVERFIKWFGKDCIDCLLADREFIGEQWLDFLNHNQIRYHIRIRNNFKITPGGSQKEIKAYYLFNKLLINQIYHHPKIVRMHGVECYLSGMKTRCEGKVDFVIIVSFNRPQEALNYYSERWQIETLFRALKTSGFNLENTHVTHLDRLEKLTMLTMLAFTWCYLVGDFIDREIKPITIKKHGRRAVSVFRCGLDYISKILITGINQLNICIVHFLSCT